MSALAELSRQYQATLEAERRTRAVFDDVISAGDVLAEAADELKLAGDALRREWEIRSLEGLL